MVGRMRVWCPLDFRIGKPEECGKSQVVYIFGEFSRSSEQFTRAKPTSPN